MEVQNNGYSIICTLIVNNCVCILQRSELTDFERFKLMKAKQAVSWDWFIIMMMIISKAQILKMPCVFYKDHDGRQGSWLIYKNQTKQKSNMYTESLSLSHTHTHTTHLSNQQGTDRWPKSIEHFLDKIVIAVSLPFYWNWLGKQVWSWYITGFSSQSALWFISWQIK